MRNVTAPDRILLIIVSFLLVGGFFIFLSASLGLLARGGAIWSAVAIKQFLYGIFLGIPALILGMRIHYEHWKKAALPIFIGAIVATALVFEPHIGISMNGARRWLSLGGLSFQPTELLKLGLVLYLSLWYSNVKNKAKSWRFGTLPLIIAVSTPSLLLVLQPDNDTVLVLIVTALAIFSVAGGRFRDLIALVIGLLFVFGLVAYTKPYVKNRVMTFIDPTRDPLGASYQVRQALIAIGSGEIMGRGFGQSVQKFNYLPEPVSDSIFAVAAEEFGFVGSSVILLFFLAFALRGLSLAAKAKDDFGRLTTTGLVVLIVVQSFLNIGAMLGVVPLSGLPLIFISQGGTALVFALLEAGIVLNISKYRVRTKE